MRTATILDPHDPHEMLAGGLPDDGAVTASFLARRMVRTPCAYCLQVYEVIERLNIAAAEVALADAEATGTEPREPVRFPMPVLVQATCGFKLDGGGSIQLCDKHGADFAIDEAVALTREAAP